MSTVDDVAPAEAAAPAGVVGPVTVVATIAATAVAVRADPAVVNYVPRCPIHALTGLDCPGCGMTRGTTALLHGHVGAAVGDNALGFLLGVPTLVVLWLYWVRHRLGGPPAPRWLGSRTAVWAWLGLTLAFTVARNLPWEPFRALAA